MIRGASARRHAQAVFQIALEKKALERWQSDLKIMAQVILVEISTSGVPGKPP